MKLNRSGVAACAIYMVAIIWLIARRYFHAHVGIDAPEFYLVTWPLSTWGLTMFGSEEFWTKYQLFFFPICFLDAYLLGCGIGSVIGWYLGFEKLSDTSKRGEPPSTA